MNAQKAILIILFIPISLGTFFLFNQEPEPKKEVPFTLPKYDSKFPTQSPAGYSLRCSRVFKPICAEVQTCSGGDCEPTQKTFPNECAAESKGAKKIFDGSCEDQVVKKESVPGRRYISEEKEICEIKEFSCEEGEIPFSDEQGCGCEPLVELEIESEEAEEIDSSKPELVETILFEGCPESLSQNTCPPGYEAFEEGEECGCKK